jgi:CubicO group peptidase (beta-lactamase class C family)
MPVPVHELATTEDYLAVLDGHASKFAPGERFAYCNAGYVVLALIAERASGMPFHELVEAACLPARRIDGHGVPALRRAPRPDRPRLRRGRRARGGATSSISLCGGAATAGSTPPPRT